MKLEELVKSIQSFFELLQSQSEKYKDHLLAGLYAFTISHAIFIWFMVWCLC